MRWVSRFAFVLVLLAVAYAAWPFWAAYDFVEAVRSRDAAAVARRVNFPALRQSLGEQMVVTYLKVTGKEARVGPFGRSMAVATVTSLADPIVDRLVSAEALMELLQNGGPAGGFSEAPVFHGLGSGSLDTVWQLVIHSEQGFRRFVLALPVS